MEYNSGQRHVWRGTVCLKLLIDWCGGAETTGDGYCYRSWQGEKRATTKSCKGPACRLWEGCTWKLESAVGPRRTLGRHSLRREPQEDRHVQHDSEEVEKGEVLTTRVPVASWRRAPS